MATKSWDMDVAVVGGGITGAAVARDAAGRGLSVALFERHDLGSGTTSRSSRMIHGGLRYLERFDVRLVRESLSERNRLFRAAPDMTRQARFRLPLARDSRPAWMIFCGLVLYDLIAGTRDMRREPDGFSYVDGLGEPERLTAALAADAARRGAEVRTYTPVEAFDGEGRIHTAGGAFRPRCVILCAGPWTDRVLAAWGCSFPMPLMGPTRGSHILMDAVIERPTLLQASSDGRVFFAVPAFGGTLVGTTDFEDEGDPGRLEPRPEEIQYLLSEIRRRVPALGESYRGAWTGLRPLLSSRLSAGARSRGDLVRLHPRRANLVVVVGGKLTTMRLMAERAVDAAVGRVLGAANGAWTVSESLPAAPDLFRVRTFGDALLRRGSEAFRSDPEALRARRDEVARSLGWDGDRVKAEWDAFRREARGSFGLEIPA